MATLRLFIRSTLTHSLRFSIPLPLLPFEWNRQLKSRWLKKRLKSRTPTWGIRKTKKRFGSMLRGCCSRLRPSKRTSKVVKRVAKNRMVTNRKKTVQDQIASLVRRAGLDLIMKVTTSVVRMVLRVDAVLISNVHQRRFIRRFVLVWRKTNIDFSAKPAMKTILPTPSANFVNKSTQSTAITKTMISGSAATFAIVGYGY